MVLASLALLSCCVPGSGPGTPMRLRVEYMERPQGVDVATPRFSWAATHTERNQSQTAYRITVSALHPARRTVWDSGRVNSSQCQNVPLGVGGGGGERLLLLVADTSYEWTVQWWDTVGAPSAVAADTFSTGLRSESDWAGAAWIGGATGQYRQTFALSQPSSALVRAMAHVVGLGYYKLWVSGSRISKHELGAFTTFESRVYYDSFDVTDAIRNTGDLDHAVGILLGTGWFALNRTDFRSPGSLAIDAGRPELRLRLSLLYADGSRQNVVSDTTWVTTEGPVVRDDVYNGETYDARLETPGWATARFDASAWAPAASRLAPSDHVQLSSHAIAPHIGVVRDYPPCAIWESAPGVFVFDFCQVMAGFVTLALPEGALTGGTNATIVMVHAEALHGPPENRSGIFQHYGCDLPRSLGGCTEVNRYIARGDGAAVRYTPRFAYAGFRYVQLSGLPEGGANPDEQTLTAHFVSTLASRDTGAVSFSDTGLNAVQAMTRASALSNFLSVPTDCPQRERRGWLGDAQVSAQTQMYNFDMSAPYTSFVQQIHDAQGHASKFFNASAGSVPDTAPYYGHGRQPADPAWGAAFTLLPDWVDTWYRDDTLFEAHYDGIAAHVESLVRVAAENNASGLLTYGIYGDWCPPVIDKGGCHYSGAGGRDVDPSQLNPPPTVSNSVLVSSFYYITQLRVLARWAARLGRTADADRYEALAAPLPAAFNARFFDANQSTYRDQTWALSNQTAIALAWQLGVVPEAAREAVIESLVANVAAQGWHLDTGIVGTRYLLPTLSAAGRADVALRIATQRSAPSYLYMIDQGATALWETWYSTRYAPGASPWTHGRPRTGVPSWNHIMFGSNSGWYFEHVAGVQQAPGARGWERVVFRPGVWSESQRWSICNGTDDASLQSARASVVTTRGLVGAAWQCGAAAAATSLLCPAGPKLGGAVAEAWSPDRSREVSQLTLACAEPGRVIRAIDFAAFGTPTGSCAAGFRASPACDATDARAKVEAACVGKRNCTIPATVAYFGDPCRMTAKRLAVSASGCNGTSSDQNSSGGGGDTVAPFFRFDVVVPTGATADVMLPTMGRATAGVSVTEGVGRTLVWVGGAFVAGASGVLGATANDSVHEIVVRVGSGSFLFNVSEASY